MAGGKSHGLRTSLRQSKRGVAELADRYLQTARRQRVAMANRAQVHEKGFTVLYEAPNPAVEYVPTPWLLFPTFSTANIVKV